MLFLRFRLSNKRRRLSAGNESIRQWTTSYRSIKIFQLNFQRMGTVHGEDLPYVFGAPLVDGFSHFPRNYTKSEVALSEALMIFWSNFARTGNPNEHHRQDPVLIASKERNRFRSIVWDEYDPVHQKYLEIGKSIIWI